MKITDRILENILKNKIIQGPALEYNVKFVFNLIRKCWYNEFTEDNIPTQESHLMEIFCSTSSGVLPSYADLEKNFYDLMGTNTNPLTEENINYIIAHLSYELEPIEKDKPTWNQSAMEIVRLNNRVSKLEKE